MISLQQKKDALLKEFQTMDINHDNTLSKQEIFAFLDSKANGLFDRSVGEQLYERMDKDFDGRISVEEFVKVFLEAEEILLNKIENSKAELQPLYQTKKEFTNQLNEAQKIERINSHGIMEGSALNLGVLQARNVQAYDADDKCQTYVVVNCDELKFQTNVAGGINPVWNENFAIDINSGKEIIQVNLIDFDGESRDDVVGFSEIKLGLYKDQLKREEWFDVYDSSNFMRNTKILLSIQWIHSKIAYYNSNLKKIAKQIQLLHEDLNSYESDLACLYEPFQNLLRVYNDQKMNENEINDIKDKSQVFQTRYFNINSNHKIFLGLAVITLLINVMICWRRSVFLEILVLSAIPLLFYYERFDSVNLKYVGVALTFITILDLFWLIFFTDGWWNGSLNLKTDFIIERDLQRYCVVLSYMAFMMQIFLILFLTLLSKNEIKQFLSQDLAISKHLMKNSRNFNQGKGEKLKKKLTHNKFIAGSDF